MGWCDSMLCVCLAAFMSCAMSYDNHLSDNTSQLLGQLVSVLDRLASLDQRFDNFDQRLNALEQSVNSRVDELKDRVDTLLARPSASTLMQDLRAVCAELPKETSSSVTDVSPPSPTQNAEVPFRITSVKKTDMEEVYRVKVTYEGSVKPTILLRFHYTRPNLPLENQGTLGMVEVDIPKLPDHDEPFLYFLFPETFVTLHLSLNNTPSYMSIPGIRFELMQGNNIMFKPGEQVKLDFSADVDGDVEKISSEEPYIQILVRSSTEDHVVDRHNSFFVDERDDAVVRIDVKEMNGTKGHRYGKAVLNSTITDVEGLFELSYGIRFNCSRNCLVERIDTTLTVAFYLEDHQGPFPQDFVGFIHDDYKQDSINQFVCDITQGHCLVYCEVVGDQLTGVEITRVVSADEDLPLDDVPILIGRYGFSQLFIGNVSFEDAGEYRCTARSQTTEISEQLTLTVVRSARIIANLSQANLLQNGSLTVTCVSEGTPTPNVTFQNIDGMAEDAYSIQVTHPTQSQTRIDLFISDPDLAASHYGFGCLASNSQVDNPFQYGYADYAYLDVNPA